MSNSCDKNQPTNVNECSNAIKNADFLLSQEIDMTKEEIKNMVENTLCLLVVCARSSDESCNNEKAFNALTVLVQHVKANIEEYVGSKGIEPFKKQVQYMIDHKQIQKDEKEAA